MGGGGLRILGHKKWHVWRRDNIERVLRDECEHAEKQRRERDEQRRRDQEVRADALGQAHEQSAVSHINFFEKEEEAHTLALLSGGDRAEPGKRRREQQPSETLGRQARLPWYATATTHEDEADSRHGHKRKRRVHC